MNTNSKLESGPKVIGHEVQGMFASIAKRYDLTNSVLSGGIHHLWKVATTKSIPASARRVLDLCTGTGDLVPLLLQPGRDVIAADFCEPMMDVGRQRFPAVKFVFADAMKLPFEDRAFDGATVAFGVRNFESLETGLRELARVIEPGGTLAILEFGQPSNVVLAKLYSWYSRFILPVLGRLLTGNGDAYRYLPETAARFPCGEAFAAKLAAAGFEPKITRPQTFGIAYLYVATRKN